ncbi:MAG: prepilin-type N-terminal cleavage/methylation domain-containing protein [Thermodesulfovibrionia bacterium]|nr:prepilin-type N-terminal cleavage/methylation domain-containing protein [Thermodesulfovibrionia bacterium]
MREQKGFTLIELAIVLVIIGIIIGAVLKGQDLIESARIKRFDNSMREWETAVWTYVDRKGTFPGDTDGNGIIGDIGTENSAADYIRDAGFINEPDANPVTIGSLNFYVQFGNDGDLTAPKNVMAICGSADCTTDALTADLIKYVESFDTVIDGVSNGANGSVVCADTITTVPAATGGDEYMVTDVNGGANFTVCGAASHGLVYFFDRGN